MKEISFDIVFTVCGHADETYPAFPESVQKIHMGFEDPPKLAKNTSSEEEALSHYRKVRDKIKTFILSLEQKI